MISKIVSGWCPRMFDDKRCLLLKSCNDEAPMAEQEANDLYKCLVGMCVLEKKVDL